MVAKQPQKSGIFGHHDKRPSKYCRDWLDVPQLLLTHFHGKVDAHVYVLGPHIVGGLGVENREDTAVQVRLASSLSVPGHSQDGSTRPVPGDQVGWSAHTHKERRLISTLPRKLMFIQVTMQMWLEFTWWQKCWLVKHESTSKYFFKGCQNYYHNKTIKGTSGVMIFCKK